MLVTSCEKVMSIVRQGNFPQCGKPERQKRLHLKTLRQIGNRLKSLAKARIYGNKKQTQSQ